MVSLAFRSMNRANESRNPSVRAGSVVPSIGVLVRSHQELDRRRKLYDAGWELHWDCAAFTVLQQCLECDAECDGSSVCSMRRGGITSDEVKELHICQIVIKLPTRFCFAGSASRQVVRSAINTGQQFDASNIVDVGTGYAR